ncbi:TIGR03086 family metal-binding protein [Streptomyces sp. NPDC017964]|uniref:TIGR03086 family metal-binding protein n=1 Tax=Streptomyces sp. NPDC017964 TaxID=3365022 RepID=UPI0037AF735C
MENEYTSMKECAAEAGRVARGVDAGRLPEPSGCGDRDVRALVNHWVLCTPARPGAPGPAHEAPRRATARDFAADTGWADAYAVQLERAVAAWADPRVWEGEIDLGFATTPAPEIAGLLIAELALHGWDVARATGQKFQVSDDTAASCSESSRRTPRSTAGTTALPMWSRCRMARPCSTARSS